VLEVYYHHAMFGRARISPAARVAKNNEFFVCLSVRHACEAPNFAMALEYRNDSNAVEKGRFAVVQSCSTFSDRCQLATPQNAEVQTSSYATWLMAGGAIRIAHYDVIDNVITRKL